MTTAIQEDIIAKLGLSALPTDAQADFLTRMAEVVQQRIALRVMKLLPESALDEYIKIVDNNEIDGHRYLSEKIPNYTQIIEEEITKFKTEIAG